MCFYKSTECLYYYITNISFIKFLCPKTVKSVIKWQSFAIHASTALLGLEVQINNQLAENLTILLFFFSSFLPTPCVSFMPELQGNREI